MRVRGLGLRVLGGWVKTPVGGERGVGGRGKGEGGGVGLGGFGGLRGERGRGAETRSCGTAAAAPPLRRRRKLAHGRWRGPPKPHRRRRSMAHRTPSPINHPPPSPLTRRTRR